MSTWMENEFMKGNPTSSIERLLSAWMDTYPSVGRHGARKLPKTWQSFQGWQRLSPGRSRKPWIRAVWSGIARRLVDMGLLVMTELLSHARPAKLLRLRQCDLVPPLRAALCNFSGPVARKLVPFWMALSSKNPLWSFTYPTFCRLLQKATTNLTLPPIVPCRRTQSGLSIFDAADGSRSLETIREALPLRTKSGIPARKSPTASPALRRTARGCVARRPAHGSSGTWWPFLKGHFVALIGSGTRQVCNDLRKHGVTARMWTRDEFTEASVFTTAGT